MMKHTGRSLLVPSLGAVALLTSITLACGGDDGEDKNNTTPEMDMAQGIDMPSGVDMAPDQATPPDMEIVEDMMVTPDMEIVEDMPVQSGAAALKFKPTYGSNTGNQIPPGWRPLVQPDGDATILVMLCGAQDATCTAPLVTKDIGPTGRSPVQKSFGPDITVEELPAGDYKLMIVADHPRSRELGFGWEETPEKTDEEAWGGRVSEWDYMLSVKGQGATLGTNPAPEAIDVTLKDGETLDLGTLVLAHFHERRLTPELETEPGTMLVATATGVRLIDLSSFEVVDAGGGFRDFVLTDAQDNPLPGSVCGMVRGEDGVAWLLYDDGTAAPFDAKARQQPHKHVVTAEPGVCRGTFHKNGGKSYLLLTKGGFSGLDPAEEGFFVADVSALSGGDVTATKYARAQDPLFQSGVHAVEARGDKVYLSISPKSTDMFAPAAARGKHNVFVGTLGANGALNLKVGGDYTVWTGMEVGDGVTTPQGNVACDLGLPFAGLTQARFHDGRDLLFLGGCSQLAVWDMAEGTQLDMNGAAPGKNYDATLYGHSYTRFSLSPDGKTLWVMPQSKSRFKFFFAKDGEDSARQTFNRYMMLPLDLSQGSAPALRADFAGEDIDGFEGKTNIGAEITPANDPGLDVNYGYYVRYQVLWSGSTAGSTFQSSSIPIGPGIAATDKGVWMHGAGIPGVSGQGKGGDLATYSIAARKAVFWPRAGRAFYEFWQGEVLSDVPFGFDLAPENAAPKEVRGLMFVP
jgi:hypothetical protein